MVCLAYYKIFVAQKELKMKQENYKKLLDYIALYDVVPKKLPFCKDLAALMLEFVSDDGDKETISKW